MNRAKRKTFSSAREVFRTYLPKSTQKREINSDDDRVEDHSTSKLLEDFKSSLKRRVRRQTS